MCKKSIPQGGFATVTLQRGELNLVVKNVPSLICPYCGETYTEEKTARKLLDAVRNLEAEGLKTEEDFFLDIF